MRSMWVQTKLTNIIVMGYVRKRQTASLVLSEFLMIIMLPSFYLSLVQTVWLDDKISSKANLSELAMHHRELRCKTVMKRYKDNVYRLAVREVGWTLKNHRTRG